MIGIVAAQPEELAGLAKRLTTVRRRAVGGLEATIGRLASRDVCLVVTGEGMRLAGDGAAALLSDATIEALLGVGVAGGLSAELSHGDVVVGRRVVAPGGECFESSAWSRNGRDSASPLRPGTVLTMETIATGARDKRRLAERLELEPPAVVDLESAAWAMAAARRGCPWLVVRAVSDTLDEDLPLDFERFRKLDGSISRSRLVVHAVTRPKLMFELDRLRRRVKVCAERLADAVEELIAC